MTSRRTTAWLLALALVAGQWLLLAHDARHWQAADADVCALCVHHAGQDLLAGPAAPTTFTPIAGDTPLAARAVAALERFAANYRSRAPPAVLV